MSVIVRSIKIFDHVSCRRKRAKTVKAKRIFKSENILASYNKFKEFEGKQYGYGGGKESQMVLR